MHKLAISMTIAAAIISVGGCAGQPADAEHPHVQVVRDHFASFNDHDTAGIHALATDDVVWFTIEGDQMLAMNEGADGLVTELASYFEALPSVHAEIEHIHAAGSYAMARERVSWTTPDGATRSQSAFSCYQFRDGKIRAVWYFPAEQDAAP